MISVTMISLFELSAHWFRSNFWYYLVSI